MRHMMKIGLKNAFNKIIDFFLNNFGINFLSFGCELYEFLPFCCKKSTIQSEILAKIVKM